MSDLMDDSMEAIEARTTRSVVWSGLVPPPVADALWRAKQDVTIVLARLHEVESERNGWGDTAQECRDRVRELEQERDKMQALLAERADAIISLSAYVNGLTEERDAAVETAERLTHGSAKRQHGRGLVDQAGIDCLCGGWFMYERDFRAHLEQMA